MPTLLDYLNKPEYAFRPSQAARRLWRAVAPAPESAVVRLPWRLGLRIATRDDIGRAIWTTGIYDLAVSEALWRLVEPGDTVVDGGANIGHMTSLMARRAGPTGVVWAFEPHPGVFEELAANADGWRREGAVARLELRCAGLSDREGEATLVEGAEFSTNRGTARLADGGAGGWRVPLARLDATLGATRPGLLKLDVEGHEAAALRGARRLLAAHAIRDVVYEEHDGVVEGATDQLRGHGYAVYRILKSFRGPVLAAPERSAADPWTPPSLLATTDAPRAAARFRRRGWACLRGR